MSQTSNAFEVFHKGPELLEKTTTWATGVVYSMRNHLKELETVPEKTLSLGIHDLRSETTHLIKQRLVPALQDSTATARVGALLSRQGQDVCQLGEEHLKEFLRGTAHLVWDCHQRTEKTAEQLRDIRQVAATILEKDPLSTQDSGKRGSPDNKVIVFLRNTLHEIFSQNDTPFDALIDWWQRTSLELHYILQNMSVIQFAPRIRMRTINKTWKTLESRYEDYKKRMDKALDATFGRNNGASTIEVPKIDTLAELPKAFLEWAEQQPGSSSMNKTGASHGGEANQGTEEVAPRNVAPQISDDKSKASGEGIPRSTDDKTANPSQVAQKSSSWWKDCRCW